ncbi:MAG: hypothetical protein ACP5NF_10165 [Thermoanaerobaculum sp.]
MVWIEGSSLKVKGPREGVAAAYRLAKPFFPFQLAGGHLLGEWGATGEDVPGHWVVVGLDGTPITRPWDTPEQTLDPSARLTPDGTAVVDGTLVVENEKSSTRLRSCRLPEFSCAVHVLPGAVDALYPLAFDDVLLLLGDQGALVRLVKGEVLWTAERPVSPYAGATIADVQANEVLVLEPLLGAVHVFTLDDGKEVFSWQGPGDPKGIAKAFARETWKDAWTARCQAREELQQGAQRPQGEEQHLMASLLGLSWGAVARFLPSGDILVITAGASSSGAVDCRGPRRAFVVSRKEATVTASYGLEALLAQPLRESDGSSAFLTGPAAGPWFYCLSDSGCSQLRLETLRP